MSVVDDILLRVKTVGGASAASDVAGVEKRVGLLGRTAKDVAGVAGLGALVFGLGDVAKAAITFETQSRLAGNALRDSGQYSVENLRRLREEADHLSTHGGFDPSQTLAGTSTLIRAHDSVSQALKDETLATDLARARHISYETAVRTVSIVEQNRTTGLSRLGVVITPITKAQDALNASHLAAADRIREAEAAGVKFNAQQKLQFEQTNRITPQMRAQAKLQDQQATKLLTLQTLWHKYGNAAETYSASPEGNISNFTHSVDILGQRLGEFLLPAITFVVTGLTGLVNDIGGVIDWFHRGGIAVDIVTGAFFGLLATLAIYKGVALASAVATGIEAFAMDAYAFAAWGAVPATGAFATALTILSNIPIVLAIMAIVLAIYLVITHFHQVKAAAIDAWHWIERAFTDAKDWVVNAWQNVVHFLGGLVGWFGHIGEAMWGGLKNGAIDVINWIIDRLNNLIDAYNAAVGWLPFVDLTVGHIGHVATSDTHHPDPGLSGVSGHAMAAGPSHHGHPGRATGGVQTAGLYEVGEQGRELVALPESAGVIPNHVLAALERIGSGQIGGSDGIPMENKILLSIGPRVFAEATNYSQAKRKATR